MGLKRNGSKYWTRIRFFRFCPSLKLSLVRQSKNSRHGCKILRFIYYTDRVGWKPGEGTDTLLVRNDGRKVRGSLKPEMGLQKKTIMVMGLLLFLLLSCVEAWTGEIHGRVVCDVCGDSYIGPEDHVLEGIKKKKNGGRALWNISQSLLLLVKYCLIPNSFDGFLFCCVIVWWVFVRIWSLDG